MARPFANVIGFDDAPFPKTHRGDVPLVGVVYARGRLDGMLIGKVRRDGANATRAVTALVEGSRFRGHIQAVLLQGIAVGGFNVFDIQALHDALGLPVLVLARKQPDLAAIERALRTRVPGGTRKWALIQEAGPMERCGGVWVQRRGLSLEQAEATIRLHAQHGALPEPLRVAHLVGAALVTGHSHGGA